VPFETHVYKSETCRLNMENRLARRIMSGLEETAKRKRCLKVFLIVLVNVVIVVSVGSFLVLSQHSSEPDPYVTGFQGSSNSSCAHTEGTIVNPRTTAISNVTLVLKVYVHHICHHDLDHHTLLNKRNKYSLVVLKEIRAKASV